MDYDKTFPKSDTLPETDAVRTLSVQNVNHTPHPFMIGPRHVAIAADQYGGKLGEEAARAAPCTWAGCRLSYDDHKSDRVAFLQLKRDAVPDEIKAFVDDNEAWIKSEKIDGFAFVETPEGYEVK